jgi:hypothetical protein
MMGFINFNDKIGIPFITAACNVQCIDIDGKCLIRVGVDVSGLKKQFSIPKKLWNKLSACIDFTNDPTNDVGGLCVSLGYWCQRHKILKGRLVSLNPLSFECKRKDYEVRFTRPMRPLYESDEQLMFEKIKNPLKDFVLSNIKSVGSVKNNE